MIADRMRLLVILLGAMTLVLLLEWVWPASDGGAAQLGVLHLPHGGPKAALQVRATSDWADKVLARPLFTIGRRPPKAEASTGAAAPDQARLSGILIGRFGKRAIFAPDGGGKPLVLGEGANVNESTIRSIEPGQVVLASGAVLTPRFDKNRTPSAPFTPPFQPVMPNFPQAPFANGQMPNPGFPMQRPVLQPTPDADSADDSDASPPPPGPQVVPVPGMPQQPVPVFRGPMIPQRRQ
jgi:hypothetical protein